MADDTRSRSDGTQNRASGDFHDDPDMLFDDPMAEIEEDIDEETGEEAAEQPQRTPGDVIQALNEENTELKNKVLNVLADMENLRRRTEREVRDARQYAIANFARDVLSVSDNLTRALQAIPDQARAGADEVLKNLLEGVELTDRDLQNQLAKNGVVLLNPEGEKFDPNFHQAMFEVPNPDVPNGTVVQVAQAGYKIGERVLRPALVGVSKGGAKAAAPVSETAEPGAAVDKSV